LKPAHSSALSRKARKGESDMKIKKNTVLRNATALAVAEYMQHPTHYKRGIALGYLGATMVSGNMSASQYMRITGNLISN
jgi:hypothetical protein